MATGPGETLASPGDTCSYYPGFVEQGLPANTKWGFISRKVPSNAVNATGTLSGRRPIAGDLVLARVERIAQHTRLQLRSGRRSLLYPGDHIVVAFGNRYAPDQFEAKVPDSLQECHLVAAGGVASKAVAKHSRLKWPTTIQPVGYCLSASGDVVNLRDFGLSRPIMHEVDDKPVIGVLGTSMNAGKTTTAAALVKGLSSAGYRVAAVKATGTGAGNDLWAYADAGAALTLDFTDAGHPSTYLLDRQEIEACFDLLLAACHASSTVDIIVVEIADGLLHDETADLVRSESFRRQVDHVVFAAVDAMGAVAGVERLRDAGIETTALSGVLTMSALATAEAERVSGRPVLTKAQLEAPQIARLIG